MFHFLCHLNQFNSNENKSNFFLLQPCGLLGRFVTIQSMEPCSVCKAQQINQTTYVEALTKQTQKTDRSTERALIPQQDYYPIPLVSIQVYGYVIGAKGREV